MQESFIQSVLLPLAIVFIMVALGMTLTLADFRRVLSQPKQVTIGLLCQMVLLPILGFGVASLFGLPPVYAVSIILLAAAPGGTTSNMIVHAAEGDRALSVTLTALSNSLAWLTMPFLLSLGIRQFGGSGELSDFPVGDLMVQVAALTIVPVLLGMGIRKWKPDFAENSKRITKILAAAFLFLIIIALVVQNWDTIVTDGPRFAPAFIVLNLAALAMGYFVPRALGINEVQSSTISIEAGMQNGTIAITIALAVLGNSEMSVIPGLYSIWMFITGFGLAAWLARRNTANQTATA